jgi:hypothetical protein
MLTQFQTVLQTQAIHPEWTARQHADYLRAEHPKGVSGLRGDPVPLIEGWLMENIGTGRLRAVQAAG